MVLRDPKSRVVVIVPPIIQFFVFSFAATFDLTDVQYAVLDQSRTVASRELLARFEGSENFKLVASLSSDNQIQEMIDTSKARLVITVPADFSDKITSGEQVVVQVIADGRNSNVASIALGYQTVPDLPGLVKCTGTYSPNPRNRKLYDELYAAFLSIYKTNKKLYKRLNRQ